MDYENLLNVQVVIFVAECFTVLLMISLGVALWLILANVALLCIIAYQIVQDLRDT